MSVPGHSICRKKGQPSIPMIWRLNLFSQCKGSDMRCVQDHLKLALKASFLDCLIQAENGSKSHYLAWQTARGPLLSLTCACGLACTLAYRQEAMALLWASRCLTAPRESVLGAIHNGSLLTAFWPSSFVTSIPVNTKELLKEAERQARTYQQERTHQYLETRQSRNTSQTEKPIGLKE